MSNLAQNYDIIIWAVACIVFFIAEAVTAGLVSIWFIAGSAIALIAGLLGASLVVEFILFLIVSIGCLFALKPLSQKLLKNSNQEKMYGDTKLEQGPIGKKAKVTEDISNDDSSGAVYLEGKTWTARLDESCEASLIAAGSFVEIVNVSGVKLLVKEYNKGEN